MEDAFKMSLVAFVVTAAMVGIPRFIAANAKPVQLTDSLGAICLPRGSALFFIALCLGFVAFGVFAIFADPAMFWVGLSLAVMFGYGVWCTILASEKRGSVAWDESGVEAPCRMYPIPFANNRKHVTWENIVSYQEIAHGVVIMKSDDGTKLVWSSYFAGADFLKDLIRRKCPCVEFK